MAASYSLHKRILPKLLFDDATIDDISNLPCVKKGPSVIILSSSKNNKSKKSGNKFIAVGRCFHVSNRSTSEPSNNAQSVSEIEDQQQHNQQHEASTTNVIVRKKLTNVINRVKMERERDKLKEERNRGTSATSTDSRTPIVGAGSTSGVGGENRRKLNIASVKSVGRTLYVPTYGGAGDGGDTSQNPKDNEIPNTDNNALSISSVPSSTQQKNTGNTISTFLKTKNENSLVPFVAINSADGTATQPSKGVTFSENVNSNGDVNGLTSRQNMTSINTATASTSRQVRMAKSLTQIEHPLPYANVEESELTLFQLSRRRVYRLVMSPWFELAVTIFILLNTVCLAIEHHNMDKNVKTVLSISNHVSKYYIPYIVFPNLKFNGKKL